MRAPRDRRGARRSSPWWALALLAAACPSAGGALPGGARVTAEAAGAGDRACWDLDGRLRAEAPRWEVGLRGGARAALGGEPPARRLAGFGELRWPRGARLLAGDLSARWAAGCALADPEGFTPWTRQLPRAGDRLLRARGTLARGEERRRGWLAEWRGRRLALSAWRFTESDGGALSIGPLGAALMRMRTSPGSGWRGSLALRPASEALLLEVAGRLGAAEEGAARQRELWLAGHWLLDPLPPLGGARAAFRWRAAANGAVLEGAADEEWEFVWSPPWPRVMAPQLAWSARRLPAPTRPAPVLVREFELRVGFDLWSGAALRCALGGIRTEEQRSGSTPGSGRSPSATEAARLTLDADVDLTSRTRLAIRVRHRGWSAADAADLRPLWTEPREMPDEIGGPDPSDAEPGAAEEAPWSADASPRDAESSDLTWVQLDWRGKARWGGCALAIAPRDNGAPAYLPVRVAPGHTQWRALARGSWMLQAWWGTDLAGRGARRSLAFEVALRAQGGRGDAPALALSCGVRGRCP